MKAITMTRPAALAYLLDNMAVNGCARFAGDLLTRKQFRAHVELISDTRNDRFWMSAEAGTANDPFFGYPAARTVSGWFKAYCARFAH
jgi:hypothetical protein